MIALGRAVQSVLGSASPVISGFSIAPQATPNMTLNLAQGNIFQQAATDATPFGTLPADSTTILQHGFAAAQTLQFDTTRLSAGQSQYALVEVGFMQSDIIRPGDPDNGIPAFFNSLNPTVPLQGQNGLGGNLPTVRQGVANVKIIYGTPATTGSQVPPSAETGYVPAWLINITFGMSGIGNAQILPASPATYAGYPYAPFLAGLENSHHNGNAGQAPKIQLGNAAEVQGVLPLPNCPGTSTYTDHGGALAVIRTGTGSPAGVLAGNVGDQYLDKASSILWVCSVSGNPGTWESTGGGSGDGPQPITFNLIAFTSSGTYTPSTGTKYINVLVVGGGGGGGGGCYGLIAGSSNSGGASAGGGGGTIKSRILLSTITTPVSITIGGGGAGGAGAPDTHGGGSGGGGGGTTSFGGYLAATGGGGGYPGADNGGGGAGGYGSALSGITAIAAQGGSGTSGGNNNGGSGGSSTFGGGGMGGFLYGGAGVGGGVYGGGGGGGYYIGGPGGYGAQGIVLIEEYIGP